ncbi:MAG TPA: glycosyltransferase family 4 protein [Anaerolineaceae bacterium]
MTAASSKTDGSICILPRIEGLGGPASFRARLVAGLQERGVPVVTEPSDPACRAILLIGGTRHFGPILQARRRGIRLVQRLNGMNWIHRRRFTGVGHFLRSEINNLILSTTRRFLADRIVYQSNFARTWWQTVYHTAAAPATVIYNGVDLRQFSPEGSQQLPLDRYRVLLVEGHLGGGNEDGLRNAAALVRGLNERADCPVELMVVGDVPQNLRARLEQDCPGMIAWAGVVTRDQIPAIDRSAHILFSADLNAACPNSVVEALACGLPVVAYATGSLPEMVDSGAGIVVPWGSNFWKLEPPDITGLVDAALKVLSDQLAYRQAARARAEQTFGLDRMVERYLDVLLG